MRYNFSDITNLEDNYITIYCVEPMCKMCDSQDY